MAYHLVYTRRACRDIDNLDLTIKRRLKAAMERLSQATKEHSEVLRNPEIGSFRMRVGDYRVIFDIEGSDIVILRVGHRREIYRRL
ncbi:MAG: type II toxin-antitoxin system RelE/ParE family toxin [Candidatus Edwardsbacteria bacterium]